MNEVTYTQDSLSISNVCPECIAQETLCVECVEAADARLTDRAYEAASEGNLMYKSQWLVTDEPSGSDWVGSETYVRPQTWKAEFKEEWDGDNPFKLVELSVKFVETDEPIVRKEFMLPIVQLQDGGELDNIWSLEDYTQSRREVVCPSCHLTTPKMFNQCQCCDATLEHNVTHLSQEVHYAIVDLIVNKIAEHTSK